MNPVARLAAELKNLAAIGGTPLATRYAGSILRHLPTVMATGSLRSIDADFREGWFRARAFGIELEMPYAAMSIVREIYGRRCYAPSDEFLPRSGDTVVDLGSNYGVFTALAAKLGARVLSVEAQSGFVRETEEVLARNGCAAKVVWGIVGGGIGDLADFTILQTSDHFENRIPPAFSIEAALCGLDRIDLLKCDIEGSEFALFENTEWLQPVQKVVMEVHPRYGDPRKLAAVLRDHGFEVEAKNDYLYGRR